MVYSLFVRPNIILSWKHWRLNLLNDSQICVQCTKFKAKEVYYDNPSSLAVAEEFHYHLEPAYINILVAYNSDRNAAMRSATELARLSTDL